MFNFVNKYMLYVKTYNIENDKLTTNNKLKSKNT